MRQGELFALLSSSPLLASIPETELARIAARLRLERFARGDSVIREGDEGDRAYFVVSGEAAVVTRDLIGEEVTLRVFARGEGFGETALAEDGRRTATVKASTDLETYTLDRTSFGELESSTPSFAAAVRRYVDLLAIDRVLKKASPFARLSPDRLRQIAGKLVRVRASRGEDIVREGQEGDRFYLIRSGRFEVLQGTRRVAELAAGDVFGEIALLTGGARIATVRTLEDGELLALAKPDFLAVVTEETGLRAQMLELGKLRFRATTGQSLSTPDPVTTLMPYLDHEHRGRYWRLLIAGVALFALASVLTLRSAEPLAIVAALVLGAFVTPVVFVVYLAESDILATRPGAVIATFALAALLGIPVSGVLQVGLGLNANEVVGAFGIAIVEEILKLGGVVWLLGRSSSRFRMDGLVFGAAAGMGFAAFETALFGIAFIENADVLLQTLAIRSVLAPLGHGTWTAIVCVTIWSERSRGRVLSVPVLAALGLAIALHALWDWQPLAALVPSLAIGADLLWSLAVGAVGILVLRVLVHRAATEELAAIVALNPELARTAASVAPRIACQRCRQIGPAGAHYCVRCGAALRAPRLTALTPNAFVLPS